MSKLSTLDVNYKWDTFLTYQRRALSGIKTGLHDLDRLLDGLRGVVVIQGAPGCNKSTLVTQIALKHARDYGPALVLDREIGREPARTRLLAASNGVSGRRVKKATVPELRAFKEKLTALPLYLETDALTSAGELRDLLGEMDGKSEGRPLLVAIDSIQSMPPLASEERQSMQAWMRELDQLKLDYGGRLTILVTSEKRRGEGGQEYERANLSAGKGAGAIEYKAEQVLDLRVGRGGQGIICEIVKNRDGAKGVAVTLELVFEDASDPRSFCYLLKEGAGEI